MGEGEEGVGWASKEKKKKRRKVESYYPFALQFIVLSIEQMDCSYELKAELQLNLGNILILKLIKLKERVIYFLFSLLRT